MIRLRTGFPARSPESSQGGVVSFHNVKERGPSGPAPGRRDALRRFRLMPGQNKRAEKGVDKLGKVIPEIRGFYRHFK